VPFIPKDLDSITPALSNFLRALTITERVIPTWSAMRLATSNPSVPSNSSRICSMAPLSEKDREKLLSRNSDQIYSEHEAIYQAIIERNPQKAREKMIEHINNIEKGMEQSFELEGES
jgi:DNA-binding FadR family transcriptional regulator